MLVAPNNNIEPIGYHGLEYGVLSSPALGAVLVQHEDIEEAIATLGFRGPQEFDLLLGPHSIQALVSNVPEAVEGKLRRSLLDQYWLDAYVIHLFLLAEVVHEVCDGQEVQRREGLPCIRSIRGANGRGCQDLRGWTGGLDDVCKRGEGGVQAGHVLRASASM